MIFVQKQEAVDGPIHIKPDSVSSSQAKGQDVPSTSQDQPSTTSTHQAEASKELLATKQPTNTSQTSPVSSAAASDPTTAQPKATQFPYDTKQPGFPIFYTLSPNQPPFGANILTPVFQPGAVPSLIPQSTPLPLEKSDIADSGKTPRNTECKK